MRRAIAARTVEQPMSAVVASGVSLGDGGLSPDLLRETIAELRSGRWRLVSYRVTEVRKQRRKRIVFCVLSYRDSRDGASQRVALVLKDYGSDRGAQALRAMRQLWRAGFEPPATHRVPRPFGYSRRHGTLVQGLAPGEPWVNFLEANGDALSVASTQAATWLVALHRTRVSPELPLVDDVAAARGCGRELVALYPEEARRIEALTEAVAHRLGADGLHRVPSHGDYHPKNVFLSRGLTTVVDFDTFAIREPAFDVGYAIGQLLIMSHHRLGDLGPGARAALAFWRRYANDLEIDWTRVAAQVARAFLQGLHYDLCTLRNGRVELLAVLPELMAQWLDCDGPGVLENLAASHRLPATPEARGA